ncbi:Sensor protein GacS [Ceratocystis platani]|uniref:histidine kinase n=1 Tax=Ceratocystis fimbriata f. sp. platani TaxID=88771 RepID=A0A0F8DGT2_CERFI|nr:Sensor protein GacS [Ceratocystis platani]
MPIVGIWKDGSVAYPNKAARSMFGKHITDNRAYYVTDLMGDWVLWNGDFTEQLPLSEYPMKFFANTLKPFEGWFIGHDVYEVFDGLVKLKPDEGNLAFLRPIESVLMGNDPEHVMEHKINGRWYRTRFVPMYSSDTPSGSLQEDKKNDVIDGVIGVIMDITEHHAAIEEETKRMQQAVANEQAAKEATRLKSQFLANMSHEFRTPIQWVLGYTDILDSTPMNKEQEQLVATIRDSATILLTLINDILDFSKIESGKMALDEVDFDLCSVLRETTEMRRFEAKNKQIDFIQVCAPGVSGLKLVGDPNRLRQILNNVLDNSVKFTREGFVLLRVEIESEMTEIINLRFTIQDSGVGIESGKQGHIFEAFHQADASTAREFGGTGLGLSICKSFLDLMHGYINLTSKHGRGTTAIIDIPFRKRLKPCDDEACHSESLAVRPKQGMTQLARRRSVATTHKIPMPREHINILLVEDNPLNAKLMLKLLGQINFKSCSHMVNGKEALDFIDRAQRGVERKPDLILMDCQMPILDGYQCAEA